MTSKDSALRAIRPATGDDHAAFVRLFPELEVDDPVLDAERFARELVPTTLVLDEAGRVTGYTYFQLLGDTAYVRHLVTAPEARRSGVGRALLETVVARARAAGCTSWCLNVKPDNAPAIALYERLGLVRAHTSKALIVPWSIVPDAPQVAAPDEDAAYGVSARLVEPDEDARVEASTGLLQGQMARARALGGRVLMGLFEANGPETPVVGASIFDPTYPGAYPFRVARPELAFVLLGALRASAKPGDAAVHVVCEGQPAVANWLVRAGATTKLDIQHMAGPLPPA